MKKYILSKLHRIPLAHFQSRPLYKEAHNLSGVSVPTEVMTLLSKGLKFIPDFRHTHPKDLVQAASKFIRAINSAVYFADRDLPSKQSSRFRLPRPWTPPLSAEGLRVARKLEQLIHAWTPSKPKKFCWSYLDRCALRWLRCNRDMVMICDADKNMGVTICSTKWVLEQAMFHIEGACTLLSDQDWEVSTHRAINEAKGILDRAVRLKVLSHAERSFVMADFNAPSPGQFRILPKVHKTPVESRPIYSAGRSWNRRLAEWLTWKLGILTQNAASVASSSDVVQQRMKLWKAEAEDSLILVTLDIQSLYPSISLPHLKWILAVEIRLKFPEKEATVIIQLLEMVLHFNEVLWQGSVYRISRGVATGSPASVIIANAYLIALDKHIGRSCNLVGYQRYIDDLLVLCHVDEVPHLLRQANSFQSSIVVKKSGEGREHVVYLDMELSLNEKNEVVSSLYSKPGALYDYTPFSSTHPDFVFHGMAKAEAWRYRKRSVVVEDAEAKLEVLRRRFSARGIPQAVITKAFQEVATSSGKRERSVCDRPLYFVLPFSHTSNVSQLKRMLRKLPVKVGRPLLALKVQRSLFRHLYGQWSRLRQKVAVREVDVQDKKRRRTAGWDIEYSCDPVRKQRRVRVL